MFLSQEFSLPPERVHLDEALPVHAAQELLVPPLDAHAPDQVPAQVIGIDRIEQLLVGDLAHVAEKVRGHEAEGIAAQGLRFHLNAGKTIQVLRDEGDRPLLHVSPEADRKEGDLPLLSDLVSQRGRIDAQDRRERLQRGIQPGGIARVHLVEGIERDGEGGNAIREKAPLPVTDLPPWRGEHLDADPVLLGELPVLGALQHLQREEPEQHERENSDHQDREGSLPPLPASTEGDRIRAHRLRPRRSGAGYVRTARPWSG